MPQTGGCKGVASIRLVFFTSDVNFQRIHVNAHPVSMEAFIQIISIDGVCSFSPLFGGFLLIPTRILQIVIIASLCIMLDVYSKRHEEPFREGPFSLDYFPFSIGSYLFLLVSFIMRLQNEDFAIRQRVAEKGSDNFFACVFTYNTIK